jgi:elongation factor Ts
MAEGVDGDLNKAFEWLRKKGATAAKEKAGRVTEQGLVGVSIDADKRSASIVEVNSETDFVAKNDLFQKLVQDVSASLMPTSAESSNVTFSEPAALGQKIWNDEGKTVEQALTDVVGVVRESIKLKRSATLSVDHGILGTYMHNGVKPLSNAAFGRTDEASYGLGTQGCVVALSTTTSIAEDAALKSELETVAKKLAMHIVASSTRYVRREDVPEEALKKEEGLLTTMALESGKKPEVVEKMVQGRLNKFYSEICLLDQEVECFRIRPPRIHQKTEYRGNLTLFFSLFLSPPPSPPPISTLCPMTKPRLASTWLL